MKFFNDLADISIGLNRLPHWEQEGATYFVTYRLSDSLPKSLTDDWNQQREQWLALHPKPWDEKTEAEYHRVFTGEIDRLMDKGHGACILREARVREILADSFAEFDGSRYVIHSWVIMPNHVHMLFTVSDDGSIETVVGGWKSYTAKSINKELGKSGSLWQKDYFDRIVRDWRHFSRVARYIRNNPQKAKLREFDYLLHESSIIKRILA